VEKYNKLNKMGGTYKGKKKKIPCKWRKSILMHVIFRWGSTSWITFTLSPINNFSSCSQYLIQLKKLPKDAQKLHTYVYKCNRYLYKMKCEYMDLKQRFISHTYTHRMIQVTQPINPLLEKISSLCWW
jgi:hypothetical protein